MTVVAGPNGSGKTTLSLELQLIQLANHLNADDLAKLRQAQTGQALVDCERWAFAEVRRLQSDFIQARRSHSYETVLSHPDHVRRALEAKQAGFHTRLIYIYLGNPDENVRRVAARVRSGGHDVPEDKIRARYARSLGLLRYAVASFDAVLAMTNDGKSPDKALELIASGGVVQCRSALNKLIDRYSVPLQRWEDLYKAIELIDSGEVIQARSALNKLIDQYSVPLQRWEDLGFIAGQSSGGWTEYCGDSSQIAESKTELVHRRDAMLASF